MSEEMFYSPLDRNSTDRDRSRNLRYIGSFIESKGYKERVAGFLRREIIEPLHGLEDSWAEAGMTSREIDIKRLKWLAFSVTPELVALLYSYME